ncbi:MAG TPA: diguanylate cyclase [Burkholderiaceae bacterium]
MLGPRQAEPWCGPYRFKGVNDEHGHAGDDVVLQGIAEALKLALRSEYLIDRFGGE